MQKKFFLCIDPSSQVFKKKISSFKQHSAHPSNKKKYRTKKVRQSANFPNGTEPLSARLENQPKNNKQ